MRLFVLAARFKRPSLAKPQTDEATGADRSNLFRQRNHGAKSFRIRPRQKRESGAPKGALSNHVRTDRQVCETHLCAACALFPARPPFGAHACGTRHRLLPRWLSSRTGFPAAAANESFARFAQKMPRLSTLRADRSLCRSTGDPKPPGNGRDEPPRAGTASRYRQTASPVDVP